uniref:Uncharacterized protein n=1 Tax=Setaria viridis TaxID=4556 RepID=A0A4U6VHS3_SETVI|nr:hypothetical protein SEVIR_3G268375v2 [Setaria viridis]
MAGCLRFLFVDLLHIWVTLYTRHTKRHMLLYT